MRKELIHLLESNSNSKKISRTKTRELVLSALFLAMALALSIFESVLPPPPTPIPLRYGLANVAVMAALLYLSYSSAAFITVGKSLFALSTRGLLAGFTSFSGSIISLLAMIVLLTISKNKVPLLILSVTGALFHNLGQFLIFLLISSVTVSWTFIIALLLLLALATGTISSLILKAIQRPLESWLKHSARFILALLIIPLSLLSLSCSPKDTAPQRQEALKTEYFDTVSRLIAYTDDQKKFDEWSDLMEQRLSELDRKFSIFDDSDSFNNLKDLNEQAGVAAVELDEECLNLLALGIEAEEQTNGKMNIMLGAVTGLWHEARQFSLANPEESWIPSEEDLQEAAKHCDINDLVLDYTAGTAYIKDPAASVDVGAIAKGHALDLIVADLKNAGAENFLLDLGGNIYGSGINMQSNEKWKIGVRNPNKEEEEAVIEVLSVQDMTVTTSGSYERSYTHEGKEYHHLIDPATLHPGTIYESVSVISPDGSWGDILSTAFFLTEVDSIDAEVSRFENVEALFITVDDERVESEGLGVYLIEP